MTGPIVPGDRTLSELEGDEWPAPEFRSYLVVRCHELRRVPLSEFSVEDVRIMIGQNIGLPFLIPAALRLLAEDLFVSGDFYDGDVLASLLGIEAEYWRDHPDHWRELRDLVMHHESSLAGRDPRLYAAFQRFLSCPP